MDRGNVKIKFTKTDFARLLNASSERFPEAIPLWEKYMEKCARARRLKISQFGFWLRENESKLFNKLYKQACKMDGLMEEVYSGTSETEAPTV